MRATAIGKAGFVELQEAHELGDPEEPQKPSARKLPLPACHGLEREGGRSYVLAFWLLNGLVFLGAAATLLRAGSDPLAVAKFAALLATGVLVSAQSSIIVTYIRMKLAMRDYLENNNKFEGSLRQQELHVKELQKLAESFERLDRQFGGSVDELGREIERLQAVSEASMRSNVKTLLRLYCDSNRDRMIEFGGELHNTTSLLEGVFDIVCPDIGRRFEAMIRALRASFGPPAEGVPIKKFLDAVDLALEDAERIEQRVAAMADAR